MFFSGRPLPWHALRKTGLVLTATGAILTGLVPIGGSVQARERPQQQSARPEAGSTVRLDQLPPQGQSTYRLILAGGPFASRKDGSVFGNFERTLPRERRGYYREYTVATPGARDRGARRIVCGGAPVTQPAACYYTGDHYATFQQIVP